MSTAVKGQHFSADWNTQGKTLCVSLQGNADMAVQDDLKAFLDSLHVAMGAAGATEAVFDLTDLFFMNSSCLSLLLRFLNGVVDLPPADRYRVRFRSNPNLRWQRRSLAALQNYAKDIVGIE